MNRETAIAEIVECLMETRETDIPAHIAFMALIAAVKGNYRRFADMLTGYSRRDCEEAISILNQLGDSKAMEAADFIDAYLLGVSA